MNTSELEARPYAPCPTCGQYSHSIGEDQIVAAYNHFQAMVCENSAKPYPTGYAFSDETRDAANVLLQSLSTLRQRIEALEAENGRLREALKRCATIVDRNLYRQHEKVEDVPKIARQALGEG